MSSSDTSSSDQELRTHGENSSMVRGFEVDAFEEWESWTRLQRLISSGHGSYGISGPRGAGKTWLIRRAQKYADEHGSIGLWFPSPSEYNSIAFLAALTERLAETVEEWRMDRAPTASFATMGPGVVGAGGFVFGVAGATYGGFVFGTTFAIVLGAAAGVAAGVVYLAFLRLLRASRPGGRALLYARDLKQRVRFALTRREGVDLGATVGGGVAAKLGVSQQMELAERPVTLSSLIHDFRRLAGLAASAASSPVVIAIDELDKIDDDGEVRRLLRDIKGVFGVQGVNFLVSVSHEAARSLNLNGIVDRNEFNSSFDVVLELDRVSVPALSELLESRGWDTGLRGSADAIAVLSGGIPREAVRLAEIVTSEFVPSPEDDNPPSTADIVSAAIAPEVREFRRVVVTAGPNQQGARIGQAARIGTFTSLSDAFLTAGNLDDDGTGFVERAWSPPWETDDVWRGRFYEEWRRLLVRVYVATLLIRRTDVDHTELQRVVQMSTQSATVAMLTLLDAAGISGVSAEFMSNANQHD